MKNGFFFLWAVLGSNTIPPVGTNDLRKTKLQCMHWSLFYVGGIGLEPTTFAMSTQRSNQLS